MSDCQYENHQSHTFVFDNPDGEGQILVWVSVDENGDVRTSLATRDASWHSWGPSVKPVVVCDKVPEAV